MATTSGTSTGVSTYSADLQQVITRAVAIASLPLNLLNSQLTTLNSRSSALTSLNSTFGSVLSSLGTIDTANNASTAVASDPSVVTVQADSAALPGSYSFNVLSAGSQTSTLSQSTLPTVDDPTTKSITSSSSLSLTVGGTSYTLNPASNSLNDLVSAINTSGAGVSASIVNLGPPSAPSYRLAIQNQQLGNTSIQLNDGSKDLLDILVSGSSAQYQINGEPTPAISSTSRNITIAPGVTAILLASGTSNIVISRTSSTLGNSLSSFVAAYNAAIDALTANRGQGGGALTGDPIVNTLQDSLRTLVNFSGGAGTIQGLADVGVNLDKTGHLSLDQTVLNAALTAHPQDVAAFIGSASSGGFLKAATDTLNTLENPTGGTLQTELTQAQDQVDRKNQQIVDEQARIDLLQTNLTARISAADALIASLQNQVSFFTSLFGSINGTKNS